MKPPWKRMWSGQKLIAARWLILYFLGKQLLADLDKLEISLSNPESILAIARRPTWILASASLYLLALLPSVWYWRHLHQQFGYPLGVYVTLRAHYIAQIGKYVPGKTLALLLRANLTNPYGVPYGVSIILSFYEVLTGMTAGGLMAALIFVIDPPTLSEPLIVFGVDLHLQWMAIGLVALCGVPLLPGVFDFIIARMTSRIQAIELYRLPPHRYGTLLLGLVMNGGGWWLQGLSFWAMLQAVLPDPPDLTLSNWLAQCTAAIAFANVFGFALIVVPGGLVVRETCLTILLGAAGPVQYVAAAAILLRLAWIVTEIVIALCLYCIKRTAQPRDERSDSVSFVY